jgi:hypothetical protein
MFIQHVSNRQVEVSFTAGILQHFYPLRSGPVGMTRRLPGVYLKDMHGSPVLQIEIGEPFSGPRLDIHFLFGEGDRLRTAEPWDMVGGVIARPRLALGLHSESEDSTEVAWIHPLGNYWKAEEDEARFREFHGW